VSAFIAAIRLLTIIPLGKGLSDQRSTAFSPAFFPLVGALVGGIVAGVFFGAAQVLPVTAAAALAIAVGVVATGALHIDGLADTADGLFGGRTPERRLEIMADPRTGSFGAAAIVLVILIKWAAISSLTEDDGWPVVIIAATPSRFAAVPVMALFRYARQQGIGGAYSGHKRTALAIASVLAVALIFVFGESGGLAAGAIGLAAGMALAVVANRRLNGVTGDVYGAVIELAEAATLVAAVAFMEAQVSLQPVWE
jgi:adenosylcobinamide-GDP ribazoletransferase